MPDEESLVYAQLAYYLRLLAATTDQRNTQAQEIASILNALTLHLAQLHQHLGAYVWCSAHAYDVPRDEHVLQELGGVFEGVVRLATLFDWSLVDVYEGSARAVAQRAHEGGKA